MPRVKIGPCDIPPVSKIEEGEYFFDFPKEEIGEQLAPLWRRVVAFLIDFAFFYFFLFQIFMGIYLPRVGLKFENIPEIKEYLINVPEANMKVIVGLCATLIILLSYFVFFEKNFGTTIGKKLLNLKLIGELNYKNIFIRNLTKSVFLFLLPIDLLGLFFFNQRLTEFLSKTKVIYSINLSIIYESW